MADLVSVKFESGDFLASLARFEEDVTRKVLFTGAATMARVIYNEVKVNVAPPKLGVKTGNLDNAIYWAHSPEESAATRVVYKISWNKSKAPHGHLIEFGHWMPYQVVPIGGGEWRTIKSNKLKNPKWVAARPFIRPAFSQMPAAVQAGLTNMTTRFARDIGI